MRLQAYEEAAKEFALSESEHDPCFKQWTADPGIWKRIVTDSNVFALEAGLSALRAYLEYGGAHAWSRFVMNIIQ